MTEQATAASRQLAAEAEVLACQIEGFRLETRPVAAGWCDAA